jgi:hypothetical protein
MSNPVTLQQALEARAEVKPKTLSAPTVYVTFDGTTTPCQWFALCDNDTTFAVDHPALGVTPICTRCATAVDIDLEA